MPTPYPIDVATDAGCLALLARKTFHSGFDKEVVDRKWPAFEEAFHGFAPERVAAMTDDDLALLAANRAIVRHRRKLAATIANARHFCAVAGTHGTWVAWLHSLRVLTYEERAQTLVACLHHVGPNTVFYFLFEAGEADLTDKPDMVR